MSVFNNVIWIAFTEPYLYMAECLQNISGKLHILTLWLGYHIGNININTTEYWLSEAFLITPCSQSALILLLNGIAFEGVGKAFKVFLAACLMYNILNMYCALGTWVNVSIWFICIWNKLPVDWCLNIGTYPYFQRYEIIIINIKSDVVQLNCCILTCSIMYFESFECII